MTGATRQSWTEVRDRIHALILNSTYAPGDKLPRDEDIARVFGCARSTVHRAMRALADSGIVERRRKGGTTVRRERVTRATLDIPITRREVEQKGAVYGYRLIRRKVQQTPPEVVARFGLPAPCRMLRVEALHSADGAPYILEDRWISLDTVPEIAEVDLEAISANEWLVLNRPYSRCDLRFHAVNASAADARMLETGLGEALLVIERTTWIGAAPITHLRAITRPGYHLCAQI
ncbi:GntR family transcriptional regulator [Rhodovulum euryhalinum]|uniref:GntR family transcriptional regulator n=1 Tax=Rhodovulum euryhalinum TaxID=35805 RepID=A0A4R2KB23_9RHOB|nr:GntR family transcriptional regulator [Rhodovulum euryhalinum]TCO69402.1 GntR family transcriptional regulator [Rhodovulum euryhalinum]